MTSTLSNDAALALSNPTQLRKFTVMPVGNIKVERIVSLADFKSKNIDFKALRPAVLMNNTLLVSNGRNFQ